MITLRSYQSRLIDEIRGHLLNGRRSILVTSPTGSGKTSLTAHMIATAISRGKRCWFSVHRVELVRQSVKTLEQDADLQVGVIAPGYGVAAHHLAQVASIQTLMRRWQKFPLPDLLVIDECHHSVSKSWSKLLAALWEAKPAMKVVGLTATPTRLDGRGLGEWFDTLVEGPSTGQLIAEGWLSKYKIFAPSTVNLSQVHTVAGDYNKAELDEAMRGSRVVGDAVEEYKTKCDGRRALMFLWSVRASEQMAETLNAAGIPAAHIDGTTDDWTRAKAVRDFRDGRIKVLTNVEIVTEGFDLDAMEAVFLLRPTQSLSLYLQMVGRGLRPFAGKEHVLIMDHAGLAFQHGLPDDMREWTLEGLTKDAKAKQENPVRQCGRCFAVMFAQAKACIECGFEFQVKPREVEQEAGELKEIDPELLRRQKRQEQGRAESYDDLREIERQRGYKPGWAKHVFAAREKRRLQDGARARYGEDDIAYGGFNRANRAEGKMPDKLSALANTYRPKRAVR